ncbi:MAG: DUF5674 family protein [Patescibacteria group bacterium]
MKIIKSGEHITRAELREMSEKMFGGMVKAVVDIEQHILAVDAEMHADEEARLLEACGSKQENLWGINFYPDNAEEGFIAFDSMINVRPRQGNRSRNVENEEIRGRIRNIVKEFVVL